MCRLGCRGWVGLGYGGLGWALGYDGGRRCGMDGVRWLGGCNRGKGVLGWCCFGEGWRWGGSCDWVMCVRRGVVVVYGGGRLCGVGEGWGVLVG